MTSRQLLQKTYPPGAVIFREGDHGDCAFIVEAGEIDIIKGEGAGSRRLGTLGPGGIFGEMALVDNQPRIASAVATKESIVILVPGATFRAKLAKADPFVAALVRLLNGSVRQLQNEITRLRLAGSAR
jgi:CRP/FNR family transcriptional regulator, cyclic AMP receptor protein